MTSGIKYLIAVALFCGGISLQAQHNVLSQSEVDSGFVLLFDGTQIDGNIWKQWDPKKSPLERNRYDVDTQEQAMRKRGGYPNGDIMIDSIYGDFVFKFEFKVLHQTGADNANSGIHYRAFDDERWASASGIEYQIMDISTSVNNSTAAAYGVYAPDPYPWKSQDWNTGIIQANGNDVEHYLNGVRVVKYNMESSDFLSRLGSSSFGTFSGTDPVDGHSVTFATSKRGWIIIQDYGELFDWWFRDVKIARLPIQVSGCQDTTYAEYNPNATVSNPLACITKLGCKTQGYVEYDSTVDQHDDRFCVTGLIEIANQAKVFAEFKNGFETLSAWVNYPRFHTLEVYSWKGVLLSKTSRAEAGAHTLSSVKHPGIYFARLKAEGRFIGTKRFVIY